MRIPSPEYDARLRAAPLYADGTSVKSREEYQHPSCPVADVICTDASNAMREEWARMFASAPHLAECVRILREALEGMLEMYDKNFKKINWGASFLDAEAIGLLNDKPLAARAALETTKEDP